MDIEYDAYMDSGDEGILWPWYLLGGLGIVLILLGAVQAALAIWQGVFLLSLPFMILSALGWYAYKYALLTATNGH